MVRVSQLWMIYTLEKAITIAEERNVAVPQDLEVYMDDCWCHFTSRNFIRPGLRTNNNSTDPAADFNDCLNSVHPRVKFTREEEEDGKIAFLDVLVERQNDGSIATKVYRKPSNTNIILKPNSCHDPAIHIATFKGEICRATRICSSPQQLQEEIKYILDIYEDNGHNRSQLEKIAQDYKPEENRMRKQQQQQQQQQRQQQTTQPPPHQQQELDKLNLFALLPLHGDMGEEAHKVLANITDITNSSNDGIHLRPNAKIPFIPGGVTYKLKRALKKAGCNAYVTAGQKLQNVLCSKNKSKPDPLKRKGVYKYNCTPCKKSYVGETARSFQIRHCEHMKGADTGKWSHSGLTQHMQHCDGPIEGPEPLCTTTANTQ